MFNGFGTKIRHKWQETLSTHRWVAYVLPMAVFLALGALEPTDPQSSHYRNYPWIYTFKLMATVIALRIVWPVYKSMIRPIGWQGIAVGVVGVVVWVSVCNLQLEQNYVFPFLKQIHLDFLFGSGTRSAFNPFEAYQGRLLAIIAYLFVRGIGMSIVVPIVEEYFLRGFVMRTVACEEWWKHPIGNVTLHAAIVGTVLPMLMHPGELIAAAMWFSLVTLLYVRTKNLWECIAAHCTTNFLLGVYVVLSNSWYFV